MKKQIYKLLPFALLLLFSCKSGNDETIDPLLGQQLEKEGAARVFAKVTMNNLRVRNTPDLEGSVVERLKDQSIIEYLQDSTSFTTMVEIKGKENHDHWYKIMTDKGNTGWVYGGCISFLSKSENQRVAAIKVDLENKKATLQSADDEALKIVQKAPKINQALLDRFQLLLNNIAVNDPAAFVKACSYYESIFSGSLNKGTADAAFALFMEHYLRIFQHYQKNTALGPYQSLAEEISRYQSPNMKRDATTLLLDRNAMTFAIDISGKVVLRPNIDKLMRRMYRLLSPAMQAYIEQQDIESKNPVIENLEIAVTIKALAGYVVFWDKYLTQYPYSSFKQEAMSKRKRYTRLLLEGSPARRAFSSSKELYSSFKDAYFMMTNELGYSPIINSFKKYLKVLDAESYTENARVKEAQQQLLNRLN